MPSIAAKKAFGELDGMSVHFDGHFSNYNRSCPSGVSPVARRAGLDAASAPKMREIVGLTEATTLSGTCAVRHDGLVLGRPASPALEVNGTDGRPLAFVHAAPIR